MLFLMWQMHITSTLHIFFFCVHLSIWWDSVSEDIQHYRTSVGIGARITSSLIKDIEYNSLKKVLSFVFTMFSPAESSLSKTLNPFQLQSLTRDLWQTRKTQPMTSAEENVLRCASACLNAAPAQSLASLLQDKHLEVLKLLMTPAESHSRPIAASLPGCYLPIMTLVWADGRSS